MYNSIPKYRPETPLLDSIDKPSALKSLSLTDLQKLCDELRNYLLYSVGQSGGHFGAGLGVVELTIALHRLLDTPADQLIWDVGHQCYPHKILTGRREALTHIRHQDGLAPFPVISESEYDAFGTGHSSTSISAALGMALANRLNGNNRKVVAVIGDGALTAGMAFEALNHAAHTGPDLLVILNDNAMSISPNQGGLATYLATNLRVQVPTHPVMPLFEALNFNYTGPIDGHDLPLLLSTLDTCLNGSGPQFLHVKTLKGKGYTPAEQDPVGFHALAKIEDTQLGNRKEASFSNIFGDWICKTAKTDRSVVAITPAMREGSDLVAFSELYPDRYFDVAIAEQHAATLAAGFAVNGFKPVLAIYSTFVQRALDQVIHDIALQNLDVLLAIDRAGLVGEDGATHVGAFDLALLNPLPNFILMTPSNYDDLRQMLELGLTYAGPAAVRYPRGKGLANLGPHSPIEFGKARLIRSGKRGAVLNFGPLIDRALHCAEALDLTLYDMRFVKPLDAEALTKIAEAHELLVTLEDHATLGGAGSAVAQWLQFNGYSKRLLMLGIDDVWAEHASRNQQLEKQGLSATNILVRISKALQQSE